MIPLIAYGILRRLGKFRRPDAAAIAAHYGSASAVTFAVVTSFLDKLAAHEPFMPVLLVALEIPAIAIGILLARLRASQTKLHYPALIHEVLMNKSVYLLFVGLLIGFIAGPERIGALKLVFLTPSKARSRFFCWKWELLPRNAWLICGKPVCSWARLPSACPRCPGR